MAEPGGSSAIGGSLAALTRLAEVGEISLLRPVPRTPTPEAALLGLEPENCRIAHGPLIIASFRMTLPPGAVGLALDVLSTEDGRSACRPSPPFLPGDLDNLVNAARQLETSKLRLVAGEGLEQGLIWLDGSTELRTVPSHQVDEMGPNLPEGDGEVILRRLIDDSINLLTPQEFNRKRMDEGLLPLNVLWPWGQGTVQKIPNLALDRGEPAWIESGSRRMMGLALLVGYRHGEMDWVGTGINVKLETLLAEARAHPLSIHIIDAPGRLRSSGRIEEAEWLMRRIDEEFLSPLKEDAADEDHTICVLAPSFASSGGLGLSTTFRSGSPQQNVMPFDERSLEEKLRVREVWDVVSEAIQWRE